MKAGVLAEPVLVGRERELEELQNCLDSAINGKGITVFVSGEAGTGKTRLAKEFLKIACEKAVAVLSGCCMSKAATPYFPFVEAFKSHYATADSEHAGSQGLEINAWLTGLKQIEKPESYRNLTAQAWKDLTFEVVSKTLQSISTENPTVLFIEDVHWADSASLALIHYLSRIISSERILVLATFRSEELTTDVEGYGHPLAEELRSMRRENLFEEIKLANLNPDYVTKIAENMVGGRVNSELAQKLSQESRGNALFVVESLRMLFERGSLYQEDDQWRLTVDTLGIPDKFKDVILRRLSQLKFNQRRVLDAASVIGEKFDVDLLSTVLNQDSLEVLEDLNTIARSTSLLRVEETFFSFDHAKLREAIYEEIALPLKRGYHKRVAEKLETAVKNGRLPLSEIAYHYAEAGVGEKAVQFAMAAGQDALARFSNAEAIKHFLYIVENASKFSTKTEIKSEALEGLGDAYFANCLFAKALELFEILADSETGAVKLRAYRKAMEAVTFGDIGKICLDKLARKAEPYASSDRLESARIRLGAVATFRYDFDLEKQRDCESALRVFEEENSLPDVAQALNQLGIALLLNHRYRKGVCAFLLAISLMEEIGDLRGLLQSVYFAGQFFLMTGVAEVFAQETMSLIKKSVQIGEKVGYYSLIGAARLSLGMMAEDQGNFEEAIFQVMKAIEISNLTDSQYTKNLRLYALLAGYYARLGDVKKAEEYLQIGSTPPTIFPSEASLNRMQELWVTTAQAILFAAKNKWKESDQYFEKSIEGAKTTLRANPQIDARRNYIWALNRQGRSQEAKAQLKQIAKISGDIEKAFAHVNIEVSLITPRLVVTEEEFEMRLYLANVSSRPGLLVKAESVVPPEFKVDTEPVTGSLKSGSFEFSEPHMNALQVVAVKLRLKAEKLGTFRLHPVVTYIDDLGETKTCRPEPVMVTVQPAKPTFEVLPNRLSTGLMELDFLLFGGIPQNYAVILSTPAIDEIELLLSRFLEAGAKADETTFYVTVETANAKALAEDYPSNFCLVLCNPQADFIIQNLPNIYKLKGVENLNEIDIALTKAFRALKPSTTNQKRICIDIISDVLLQHHPVNTRRWLSALLPTLKMKGFTILAVLNPQMHPPEEVQAILGLFDGEIRISEQTTPQGMQQTLRIQRMHDQKFSDTQLVLNKEKLK